MKSRLLFTALPALSLIACAPSTPEVDMIPVAEEANQDAQAIDDEAVRALSRAIQIRTISHDNKDRDDPAAFNAFHQFLRTTYPAFHRVAKREVFERFSLLYTWRGSDPALPPIVLLAHQDVVPAEETTLDQWIHPPFGGAIADGYVWGRGALDMKGQLVGMLEALDRLAASGFRPKRTILVALGEDEETAGDGARAMATAMQERGIDAEFVLDEGPMVLDPFSLTDKPAAFIGIGEKGYGTLKVVARDKGGHSSAPPPDPAVERLAKAVVAIQNIRLERRIDKDLRQTLQTLSDDFDGISRVAIENLWAFGPLVKQQLAAEPAGVALMGSTLAPTVLKGSPKENILPEFASVLYNVRIHPRDNADLILTKVQEAIAPIDGVDVSWIGTPSAPPPVADTTSEAYALVARHAKAIADMPVNVAPALVFGATDSRFYRNVSDSVLRFQPLVIAEDEIERIHGVNERLSVENVTRVVRFYEGLVREAAGL
ncbi:MAG: M20/M25/M40 family metallo-hydrolase [Pseudomonadota bacterium]